MALTGLQIQKLLPGTNCRECGSNTCLAFAMKLAAKKAELAECPYASDEAKRVLGAASEPPVRTVKLGADGALALGGETVLYRHEKTFVNRTAFAVCVYDTDLPGAEQALAAVRDYVFERVGERFGVDMVAVVMRGSDPVAYAALAKKAHDVTGKPLVLVAGDKDALSKAAAAVKGTRGILCPVGGIGAMDLAPVALECGHAMAVTAPDVDSLAELTVRMRGAGLNDIILNFTAHSPAERFQTQSIARRAAIKDGAKAMGYPFLAMIDDADDAGVIVSAATGVLKYGGVCVLPSFDPAQLAALITLRLNIYTDPQRPIQVEPKVYAIGEPGPDSPVFVTTNFSLTYFVVSGEIENTGVSAWLVVPDSEGMSVLTGWAAGKFTATTIAQFVKESGLEERVKTREIVIPGYVSQISGELEEKLPGWKAVVGPQEAADIESFVRARMGA